MRFLLGLKYSLGLNLKRQEIQTLQKDLDLAMLQIQKREFARMRISEALLKQGLADPK